MNKDSSVVTLKKAGRKPEVTLAQVIKAAEILKQQKRDITGWTLRDVIGSGGPNYLNELWLEHEKQAGIAPDDIQPANEEHVLSTELEKKVNSFLADISTQINNFALESDQLAIRIAERKAKAAYEILMTTNKQLVDEQDLANRMIEEADTLNQQQLEALQLLEEKNIALSSTEQQLLTKIEKLEANNLKIQKNLEACRNSLESEKARVSELEKSEVKLATKVEIANDDKNKAFDNLTNIQKELTEAVVKLEALERLVKDKDLTIDSLKTSAK